MMKQYITTPEFLEYVTRIRRDLHQIPELGFCEEQTQRYIIQELEHMGYTPHVIAKTGVYVYLDFGSSKTLGFRADIDALPIQEETDVSFASRHEGRMHACGHDGHTAMLLGFASMLMEYKKKGVQLSVNALLFFQPAEEGPGGASAILEEGLFEKHPVEAIYGIHLWPLVQEHVVCYREGEALSSAEELNVYIHGTQSHGAAPHLGKDSLLAAAAFLQNIQTIVSRRIDPLDPVVLTFGKIFGGEARNIIAGSITIEGTLRTFSSLAHARVLEELEDIAKGIEHMYGVRVEVQRRSFYPVLNNARELTYRIEQTSLKKHKMEALMIAEDFAFYTTKCPSYFILLGCRNESKEYIHPLHHPKFQFDESVLVSGVQYYHDILLTYTSENSED